MGFYDTVLERCKHIPEIVVPLRNATVIRAQNVMNYYALQVEDATELNKQIGIITPPFDEVWIETSAPKGYRLEGVELDWPTHAFRNAGVLMMSQRNADGWDVHYIIMFDMAWVVKSSGKYKLPYPNIVGDFHLDAHGHATEEKLQASATDDDDRGFKASMAWNFDVFGDMMMLALSFMNCRNVALDTTTPTVLRTKEDVRHNVWPMPEHEFRTIHITPFVAKKPSKSGGNAEPAYHQRSHIIPGYFRTYTEESPLFGKPGMSGQFWMPQRVSGKRTEDITADYQIDL